MIKLAKKYEKMIEYEDKIFYSNFKKKNAPKVTAAKKKTKTGLKKRPFIPYKQQLTNPLWKKRRKQVLEYKGRKCEICGATQNLQIHHLRYIVGKYAWEYKMKDFIVLCSGCHEKIHGIDLDKRMNELIEID